jgi:hypothetical protein
MKFSLASVVSLLVFSVAATAVPQPDGAIVERAPEAIAEPVVVDLEKREAGYDKYCPKEYKTVTETKWKPKYVTVTETKWKPKKVYYTVTETKYKKIYKTVTETKYKKIYKTVTEYKKIYKTVTETKYKCKGKGKDYGYDDNHY